MTEAEKMAGFLTAMFNEMADGALSLPAGTTQPVGVKLFEDEDGARTSLAVKLSNNVCLGIDVLEIGTFHNTH